MVLVITLLAFAVALGLTVGRVGLGTYAALFIVTFVGSVGFMLLYFRLFL